MCVLGRGEGVLLSSVPLRQTQLQGQDHKTGRGSLLETMAFIILHRGEHRSVPLRHLCKDTGVFDTFFRFFCRSVAI